MLLEATLPQATSIIDLPPQRATYQVSSPFYDPLGTWASTTTWHQGPLAASGATTGPDGEPWLFTDQSGGDINPSTHSTLLEWETELFGNHNHTQADDVNIPPPTLDADAETAALPPGLLSSPERHDHGDRGSPDTRTARNDTGSNIDSFTTKLTTLPPSFVLPTPTPPAPPAFKAKTMRHIEHVARRPPSSAVDPFERAREIQMKKWGILPAVAKPQEEHKKRYLAMYDGPMTDDAVKAIEQLLDDTMVQAAAAGSAVAAVST